MGILIRCAGHNPKGGAKGAAIIDNVRLKLSKTDKHIFKME